jgi:Ser/Thr protein kinase RdoA (MazF antagonist)
MLVIGGRSMNEFFRHDTDDTRKSLLIRARKVALLALQQYELEWESIQYIGLSDTITYKIETSTEGCYLLRIHSDRWSKEEIESELAWLRALNKLVNLNVPVGLRSSNGSYVLEIHTEEGYRRPYVTMMKWVDGDHVSGELRDSQIYNMGVMMGRLHEATVRFHPSSDFVRPTWGVDSFRRDMAKLKLYYTRILTSQAWRAYQEAAEKIVSELSAMQQSDHNYGLIHADLHTGNIVFNDNTPNPIDFGRSGYGYFLYDMAGSLLGLNPEQRKVFIQGYKSVKELDNNYAKHLECFFIMFMIENYCHHASDPRETASLIDEQQYAQAYIREYLHGKSFLFDVIHIK